MTKTKRARGSNPSDTPSEAEPSLHHLRREVRTALELAVVALAPSELVGRLAAAAGLLEAIVELPASSPPALSLIPGLVTRTQAALTDWQSWRRDNLEHKIPRS